MSIQLLKDICRIDKQMRNAYVETLIDMAEEDKNVVVLEADLLNSIGNQTFKNRFPDRIFNCGIQEANMIGIAAGLSATGKIPFVQTFASFASRRCYDQTFISASYAKLNVKIVGSDPGILASHNGGTHMSFEDMGIMRNIPEITLVEPADMVMLKSVLRSAKENYGVYYIRLLRKEQTCFYGQNSTFTIGKANVINEGSDVTIITSGYLLNESLIALEMLKKIGISVRLIDMFTWKPIDKEIIIESARKTGAIVTVENHSIVNGLGSAVSEILSRNRPVPMEMVGINDLFGEVGDVMYLKNRFNLTASDIVLSVKKVISRK